ncbi:MAG TPA: putative Ig domain-containing protein [Chthoniobacterales bacterium]|nr:putative Ig domain-containing protein [Chthoniobacterales bacterium]
MPNSVKIGRFIFTQILLGALAGSALGEGVTYPDGTVSAYPPDLFGIGFAEPYLFSEATGVASENGVFKGAIGIVSGAPKGYPTFRAVYIGANRQLSTLHVPELVVAQPLGINANGTLIVGGTTNPVVWESTTLEPRTLAPPDGYSNGNATAITADGLAAAGWSQTGEGSDIKTDALFWLLNGPAQPRLVPLPDGYDSGVAQGVMKYVTFGDNTTEWKICGTASNHAAQQGGATPRHLGFLAGVCTPDGCGSFHATGLLPLQGHVDSEAFALAPDKFSRGLGAVVVGQSLAENGGSSAVYWAGNTGAIELPGFSGSATTQAAAFAISDDIVVGAASPGGFTFQAVRWDLKDSSSFSTIAAILVNKYKVPVGKWQLTAATGISADGLAICGRGINPDGKSQGWVALLPKILHPPKVARPPDASPPPGELFAYQVTATNNPTGFFAKGLPPGFKIDGQSGIITGFWSKDEVEKLGHYTVTVTVVNSEGSGTASFGIALLPPFDSTGPANKKTIQGHSYLPYNKPPGETYFPTSFGLGLSGNGEVAVGYSGPNNDPRAYYWTPASGMIALPTLAEALYGVTRAEATSGDGQVIVGQAVTAPDENGVAYNVAVKWNLAGAASPLPMLAESGNVANATIVSLGFIPPNGTSSVAKAVSADGSVIVGEGSDYNREDKTTGHQQAFRWSASDGMVGLGWLPGSPVPHSSTATAVSDDGSVVVGGSNSGNGSQAFRWTAAEGMTGMGILPGASFSRATGISGDKTTIIGHNGFSNRNRAFRWTASQGMQELGTLPGDNVSEANAASFDGSVIVGKSTVDFNPSRAFIWDQANGMRDLKQVVVGANPALANWSLRTAESISADGGTVVGYGVNPNGDLEGFTAFLEVKPRQLLNIATRMRVLTGDNVLIGGFIITGTEPKKVIIRGIGPALAGLGLQGTLADPKLELHQGNTTLASNDNWKENQAEVEATTIPPGHDLESAIVITLNPGSYTAILSGKDGGTGVGVVEVYDLAQGANAKLANISSRGFVDSGDNVMIGGLILGGGTPVGSGRVLIRAIGPSLANAGVAGPLQDPVLELFNNNGTSVGLNNDWQTSQKSEIEGTTIPPADPREAAILATLPGGNYTAVVRGSNNTTGVAVVEAFNLPE